MRFKQIFNNLVKWANIDLLAKFKEYYCVDPISKFHGRVYFSKDIGSSGIYHSDAIAIGIRRRSKKTPNISYLIDIIILLHELGHHQLVCKRDKYKSLSATGFIYGVERQEQLNALMKEEFAAWVNAFRLLLNAEIKGLTIFYKVLISLRMIPLAINCLYSYGEFAIDELYKKRISK